MTKHIVTLACIGMGLFWAAMGWFRYAFWMPEGGPGGGFFPVLIGLLVAGLALVVLVRSTTDKPSMPVGALLRHPAWIPPLMVLAAMGVMEIVGMLPAILAMVTVWLMWFEKMRLVRALCISLILTAVVYGVFSVWLKVPFPLGLFEM